MADGLIGKWILFPDDARGEIVGMIGADRLLVRMVSTDAPSFLQLKWLADADNGFLFANEAGLDAFLAWSTEPAKGPKIVSIAGGGEKEST